MWQQGEIKETSNKTSKLCGSTQLTNYLLNESIYKWTTILGRNVSIFSI
jgi:hypothetical protein